MGPIYVGWRSIEWLRRIFEWIPMRKRSRGHPRNRWQDEVLKNIRVQG
jgi:hypothetical protein